MFYRCFNWRVRDTVSSLTEKKTGVIDMPCLTSDNVHPPINYIYH